MKLISTRLFLLIVPALLLPVLAVTTVEAARPTVSTGNFSTTSNVLLSTRTHGDKTISTFQQTISITGILMGTIVGPVRNVLNSRTHTLTIHGSGLFTGTANGQSGTLILIADGRVVGGTLMGRFTVSHGTGDLAGFSGHGTFTAAPDASTGDYTLTWHVSDSSDSD